MRHDLVSVMGASISRDTSLHSNGNLMRYGDESPSPPAGNRSALDSGRPRASRAEPWAFDGVHTQRLMGAALAVATFGAAGLVVAAIPQANRAPTGSPSRRVDPRVPPEEPDNTLYKTTAVAAAAGVGLALLASAPSQFRDEPQPQAEKDQPKSQPRRLFTIDAHEALVVSGAVWLGLRSMIYAAKKS